MVAVTVQYQYNVYEIAVAKSSHNKTLIKPREGGYKSEIDFQRIQEKITMENLIGRIKYFKDKLENNIYASLDQNEEYQEKINNYYRKMVQKMDIYLQDISSL